MKTVMLCAQLFVHVSLATAQGSYSKDSLVVVQVKDTALVAIIDSLVDFEKRCDNYRPDLIFSIFLHMDTTVQIGSISFLMKSEADLGCFMHGQHLFIVTGRNLNPQLFQETNKKMGLVYYDPDKNRDPKTGKVIILPEDDSGTHWLYKYVGGKFILIDRFSSCK